VDYQDRQLFTNSTAYNTNLYLYYILTEQRDLFIDYGNRYTSLSNGEYDIDNSIRGGVSGRVFGPFNGSLQVGASRRTPYNGPDKNPFNTFSGSGSLTWNVNRKVTLSSDLARDFSTTATAVSLESSTAGFTLQDSFSNKAVGTIAATVGQNRFLGVEGEVAPHNAQRVDDFYSL
jgi:Putative beta-barrel porin 2